MQKTNNTNDQIKGQKCLRYPQTKMPDCPHCVQKYNTRGMVQVRHNIRERSPKLEWQTFDLKNTIKTKQTNKIKSQGKYKGCLPQALCLTSSARLTTGDDNYSS